MYGSLAINEKYHKGKLREVYCKDKNCCLPIKIPWVLALVDTNHIKRHVNIGLVPASV